MHTMQKRNSPYEGPVVNWSLGNEKKPILEQIFFWTVYLEAHGDTLLLRMAKGQNQGKRFKVFPG